MNKSNKILVIIVVAQFFCTSLWFAGNGVIQELISNFHLEQQALGHLTSSVQLGFIIGTLVFAVLAIADRFSPSKVFFVSAVIAALSNLGVIWEQNTLSTLMVERFFTGFFLAGIYPVGMKIAADYFEKGLGKSLGFLVGALVLGTAFPHLLKEVSGNIPWRFVIITTSSLATLGGGLMLLLVPDGPNRKASKKFEVAKVLSIFKNRSFRSAAFGYFGHMWELYAFWAFVPLMITAFVLDSAQEFPVALWSFVIIAVGGIACVIGGFVATKRGAKSTAVWALGLSCLCCLVAPMVLEFASGGILLLFLLFWGMVVVADSPLFSTLVAQSAPAAFKGTALTIVNCIGFSISIVSIQLLNSVISIGSVNPWYFMILALGPILGLLALESQKQG